MLPMKYSKLDKAFKDIRAMIRAVYPTATEAQKREIEYQLTMALLRDYS